MFTATSRSMLLRLATALALVGCVTLAMSQAQDPVPAPTTPAPAGTSTPPATNPPATSTATSPPANTLIYEGITLPAGKYMTDDIKYLSPSSTPERPSIRRGRPSTNPDGSTPTKPFTGYLKIRQQNGSLTYDINVLRGKVVSGIESHRGSDAVTSDIVGGWFNRDRLVLMIQGRNLDINGDWAAHLHQFRRTEDGFVIDHSLLGYGKSDENYAVYRPHTIDRMVEFD